MAHSNTDAKPQWASPQQGISRERDESQRTIVMVDLRPDGHCRGATTTPILRPVMAQDDRECETGKALVRLLTRVGEDSPAGCGSAQESGANEAYASSGTQAMRVALYRTQRLELATLTDDSYYRLGLATVTEDYRLKTDDCGTGTGIRTPVPWLRTTCPDP